MRTRAVSKRLSLFRPTHLTPVKAISISKSRAVEFNMSRRILHKPFWGARVKFAPHLAVPIKSD